MRQARIALEGAPGLVVSKSLRSMNIWPRVVKREPFRAYPVGKSGFVATLLHLFLDDMAEIPLIQRDGREGPIPSAWRPVLSAIVDAFVRHDYGLADGIAGVAPVDDDTATQIRDYIDDYGETLVALPEAAWDMSVCIRAGNHWDALIDLWTEDEGRSDLVLQVRVSENAGDHVVTVHMVYVP